MFERTNAPFVPPRALHLRTLKLASRPLNFGDDLVLPLDELCTLHDNHFSKSAEQGQGLGQEQVAQWREETPSSYTNHGLVVASIV